MVCRVGGILCCVCRQTSNTTHQHVLLGVYRHSPTQNTSNTTYHFTPPTWVVGGLPTYTTQNTSNTTYHWCVVHVVTFRPAYYWCYPDTKKYKGAYIHVYSCVSDGSPSTDPSIQVSLLTQLLNNSTLWGCKNVGEIILRQGKSFDSQKRCHNVVNNVTLHLTLATIVDQ